jgi:putative phosphoesterase
MVRIVVLSDTHGDLQGWSALLAQVGPVDWLFHAGDFLRDAALAASQLESAGLSVRAVVGNCDIPVVQPAQELIEIDGVRILLTHGHHEGVKSRLDRLYYRAKEFGAQVAIFGHSHVPVSLMKDGVLLFNPGSATAPRDHHMPSCGLIEIASGIVSARHLFLGGIGMADRN